MAGALRIVFIALAIVSGIGLVAAGALGVWDLLQPSVGDRDTSESAPPFSFSTYGYTPAIAMVVLASAVAALKRNWDALTLVCWLLTGALMVEALEALARFALAGATTIGIVWLLLLPLLGLVLARAAKSRAEPSLAIASSPSSQDRIRLRNTLIGLAALSYLWRAVTVVLTPETVAILAYFRGTSEAYLMLGSIVGVGASVVLLCAVAFFKGRERFLMAVLAFTAGLAFEGFLRTLDLALNGGSRLELVYALQDAVAFAASCAALLVSAIQPERASPRLIT